ncbi:MAG TPA: cytochrome c, partial [Blastocatellia bacterium]
MNKVVRVLAATTALLAVAFLCVGAKGRVEPKVTFDKDVAPIFYERCAECHRPGEVAPMSLLTYKDARPWARSIKDKVASRIMPPWLADESSGHFSNDRRLTQKQVDTIVAWVDAGAPEGNPKDLPAPPKFVEGWSIGQPDVVIPLPEEISVPATGTI